MEIEVTQEQGRVPVTVFHIKGALLEEESLQRKAQEAFDEGARNIVLDLSETPYMASSGLRALHHVYMLLRTEAPDESDAAVQSGIRAGTFTSPHLKVANPNRNVLEVLKTAGYDMFLQIHRNRKEAIASF